jgi:predicted nucleotidyltransferase
MSAGTDPLLAVLPDIAAAVFDGSPVFLAYAYGSRVVGNATPSSDLDVGVFHPRGTAAPQLSLYEEMVLADRLSRSLGVEVDLRNLSAAPLEWQAKVLREGVCVYSRDEVFRVGVERDTLVRWFDQQDRFAKFHEERLRAFAAAGLRGAEES